MSQGGEAINFNLLTRYSIIFIFVVTVFVSSCSTPAYLKHAVYFQDSVTQAEKNIMRNPVVIKPGDRLSISITAINKEAAEAFNITSASTAGNVSGYLVDSSGNIQLLQLGVLHVGGYTTPQLKDSLEQMLTSYIKGPLVTVSIVNFQVNMMGEIGHPGTLTVTDGKMTVLQAITAAGDITQYGKRDNILVIRETNGLREFGRIDISSNHVFESPYFYLQQNDIVYVEPDQAKFNEVGLNRNLRNLGIATSVITFAILLLNLAKR